MNNPYHKLPATRYWKSGVAEQHPFTIAGLYQRKFRIGANMPIATAGSCFAQHIGTNLKRKGYHVLDVEEAPTGMTDETAHRFGYRIYSARYGNIYSARQLLQLTRAALGLEVREDYVWSKNGRYFDALRPAVEPDGLDSAGAVRAHRAYHLQRVRKLLEETRLFIFTLGLTEAWIHKESGTVYPTAPGVIAGEFSSDAYAFVNFGFQEILADLLEFRKIMRALNPGIKFLLTVSPVPLTATASDHHVLVATTYSKSVLRAVAGELEQRCPDVDYFPSYELIASPFARGFFYSPNLRSVEPGGVQAVMRVFFSEHQLGAASPAAPGGEGEVEADDPVCEEVLLEAFAK